MRWLGIILICMAAAPVALMALADAAPKENPPKSTAGKERPARESKNAKSDKSSTDKPSTDKSSAIKAPTDRAPGKKGNQGANRKPASDKRPAPKQALSREQETAALAMAREHHPELSPLLRRLRGRNPVQYQRAIRQLYRASERLSQWKDRDADRYALELEAWKIESRLQLLAARSTMSPDGSLDREIRSALERQIDVRMKILRHQRDQIARRVEQFDDDLERMRENRQRLVEQRLNQVRRGASRADRLRPAPKNDRRPAKKKANRDESTGDQPKAKPAKND